MTVAGNLVGYQLVWFAAVIGAARDHAWTGVSAALFFALWQLSISRDRRRDLRLMLAASLLGVLIDGALAASGLLHYAAASPALPPGGAPLWILAVWAAFALTFATSLVWLRGRMLVGALIGAVGAPAAYLAAARGWDAVTFTPPAWAGVLGVAVGYAAAMTVLLALMARWSGAPGTSAGVLPGSSG